MWIKTAAKGFENARSGTAAWVSALGFWGDVRFGRPAFGAGLVAEECGRIQPGPTVKVRDFVRGEAPPPHGSNETPKPVAPNTAGFIPVNSPEWAWIMASRQVIG